MQTRTCPELSEWQAFVRCDLPEPRTESLNAHLLECPECEATVAQLEHDGDTVARRIRSTKSQPSFAGEPECQAMLQTLVGDATIAHPLPPDGAPPSQIDSNASHASVGGSSTPNRLRDYQLLEMLGEGGMGAVYKAQHQRLKRTAAVKILPMNRLSDPQSVARFEREMEVLGQLNHPHIVQALDAGEHEGRHYLVMEYVEGLDLAAIVKSHGPLRVADACQAISEAALGLQYAHEHGYVHRDIKPSNLMVAKRGAVNDRTAQVKILDLGLARALHNAPNSQAGAVELTATSQVMGTLDYMAPEQGGDAHRVDIRADIYSLGATLYKLLTGDSPFAEHAHKPPLQRLMAVATAEPPPVQSKRPDLPAGLAGIVQRMMAKQPDDRFATPADVVAALAPYCSGADLFQLLGQPNGESRDRATDIRSAETQVATQVASRGAAAGRGRIANRKAVAAAFFGAGLAALAVILAIATRHGTIVVESPDGKLPDDVRIAVAQGGEEVAVLQAGNEWSARVVNGEYQLQVRGGNNRFELVDSKLNVSRLGRVVVQLQVKKDDAIAKTPVATKPAATTPTAATPSATPSRPKLPAAADRPFVLVRQGQDLRQFKSLAGAISDQKPGDVIEVRSNEQLAIAFPSPAPKTLAIRAGAGFRPQLKVNAPLAIEVPADALWSIEGCDLDLRGVQLGPHNFDAANTHLQLAQCRLWGGQFLGWTKVNASDCIFVSIQGAFYTANCSESQIVLENCALQNGLVFLAVVKGKHSLSLRHCTYYEVDGYAPHMISSAEGANVVVDASHCLFHRDSQNPNLILADVSPRVTWNGDHNRFSGHFCVHGELQADGTWKTLSEGLAAWKKRPNFTEVDSIEGQPAQFALGRLLRMADERLPELARTLPSLTADAAEQSIGPDWSLVGAGDAYVRALAAAGRPVAEEDLRPEQLAGGPFTLLVEGAEARGFASLAAALASAPDGAVVEIRSDGPFPLEQIPGQLRRLVVRAAAGFRPVFYGLQFTDGALVELEGIVAQRGLQLSDSAFPEGMVDVAKPARTRLLRAMNCEITHPNHGTMKIHFAAEPGAELVNCSFGHAELYLDSKAQAAIRNSVGFTINTTTIGSNAPPAKLTIDRCALFCPEPPLNWVLASLSERTPTRFESRRTLYIAPRSVLAAADFAKSWSGDHNCFLLAHSFLLGGAPVSLAEVQKLASSDAHSRELFPWQTDPRQWQLDEPAPNLKGYGVDVSRMLPAAGPGASAPARNAPQPTPR